jgi:multiple sugar transport system ATP-binding protein
VRSCASSRRNKGRIEQVGSPLELYHQPANQFVATFIGSPRMNLLAVTAEQGGGEAACLRLPGGKVLPLPDRLAPLVQAGPLTLGIRPEHIELLPPEATAEAQALSGQVVVIEYLGNETFAHVALAGMADGLLVLRLDAESPLRRGEALALRCLPERLHLFDAAGHALVARAAA